MIILPSENVSRSGKSILGLTLVVKMLKVNVLNVLSRVKLLRVLDSCEIETYVKRKTPTAWCQLKLVIMDIIQNTKI